MPPSPRPRTPSPPSSPLSSLPPSPAPASAFAPLAASSSAPQTQIPAEPVAPTVKKFGSLRSWLKFKRAEGTEKEGLYAVIPKPPTPQPPTSVPPSSAHTGSSPSPEPTASGPSTSRAVLLPNGMAMRPRRMSDLHNEALKRVLDKVVGVNRRIERQKLFEDMIDHRERAAGVGDITTNGEQRARLEAQEKEIAAMRRTLARQEAELVAARRVLKRHREGDERDMIADADEQGFEHDGARDDIRPAKTQRTSVITDAASTASAAPSTASAAPSTAARSVSPSEESLDEVDLAEEYRARIIRAVKQEIVEDGVGLWATIDAAALTDSDRADADAEMSFVGRAREQERPEQQEEAGKQQGHEERVGKGKGKGRADASYYFPPPTSLTRLAEQVSPDFYRSSTANKELENLRIVLLHRRTPITLAACPSVADPIVILEQGNISSTVFQDAKPAQTGAFIYNAIGFTKSTNYLVATPNAQYLPHVPDPDVPHRIRMRCDCRFGAEDITLVPTYYMPNFAGHVACIPARPPSSSHPAQVLWMAPDVVLEKISNRLTDDQDTFILTEAAVEQFRRLIVPLRKRANKYLDFCKRHGVSPIVWARGLEIALGHIFERLKYIPSPRTRAHLMVREMQRLALELMGMMNFVFEVQPILTGLVDPPEYQGTRYYLGAITCDPAEAQALYRAGVPVWQVFKYDSALRQRMRDPALPFVPHATKLWKLYAPEEMAETGRHPDNLPYIFEGLPTNPDRLRQIHRYSTQTIAVHTCYRDDLSPETGRDPYAYKGTSIRIYGASHLRPLEDLLGGGDRSSERRRPRWPILGVDPIDELPAAPRGSSDPADEVLDMPMVDLDQSDIVHEEDPPAPEAFIVTEDEVDIGLGLEGAVAASSAPPAVGPSASSSTSRSASAAPSTSPMPAASSSTTTSDSGSPIASTSASALPLPAQPINKRIEGQSLWRPIGVHDPRRKGKQNPTGALTRNHKLDLPTMPPAWARWCSRVCDNWRHDGAIPGDSYRTFPLPAALVGPNSDAKVARFVQVWLALEDGAIDNARRNPRDPGAFQRHSIGMTWVQPEGTPVTDRKDFVRLPDAARTPVVQEQPCLAVNAQIWKDVLNAHTTFRAQGLNRQSAIMAPVRDIFGQTFDFGAVLSKLEKPYRVLGELVLPGHLPCRRTMMGILWRLHELVFRKDLMDLDRRLRILLLTPAEEHHRLRQVFPLGACGADILTVIGTGEVDRGLVAEQWTERYPYVFALGALMLDWAEPLPERVREALQAPKMSERQFLWLESKVVEHYVAMLFAYFQRKAVGPARRSVEI